MCPSNKTPFSVINKHHIVDHGLYRSPCTTFLKHDHPLRPSFSDHTVFMQNARPHRYEQVAAGERGQVMQA